MEKLLIIDGNSLVNRAFYALPLLTNDDGEYSNAVYGFCNILIKFIIENKPTHIAVAFDAGKITFRNEIYSDYKGTRKGMPDELRSQMPILKNLLSVMGIKMYEQKGIEADDIIGSIAKQTDVETIILSGDRDVLQLIDSSTSVWLTKKGISEVKMMNELALKEEQGIEPFQIIELKSLMGDTSDNIPGVRGVGEKTASDLICKYQTLNGVYEHIDEIKGKLREKLEESKNDAYMSHKLATIKTDCDVSFNLQDCDYSFPFNQNVKKFFEKYKFNSLLKRKELFDENNLTEEINKINKKEKNIVQINNINQIKEIIKTEKINYFAFNFLNNIKFSFNDVTEYNISMQFDLFSEFFEIKDVVSIFEEILNNDNILKITYDIKSHCHLDNRFVSAQNNVFDIMIASYLCHGGEKVKNDFEVFDYYYHKQILMQSLTEQNLLKLYNEVEVPLTFVLFDMEKQGFVIDSVILDELHKKYEIELEELTQKIYELAGQEFNINSPKQLANVLFDTLGLTENKKRSTGIEILTALANEHEIIPFIIRYRKIYKLQSTYIDVYKNLVKTNGNIIYTIFNQTQTSTGRLSSSEPNLQNLPVRDDEGRILRKMFISRFENGHIVSADYNQIELRLLANMCQDENLVNAYKQGKDIHSLTASLIFDCDISQITSKQRSFAKAVNFGIIYGMGAHGLATQIGVSNKQAKIFIDKYFESYPKVKDYMDNNVELAKQNGYAKTLWGRIRNIPELSSSNGNLRNFGERVAKNMPLQGSASDIIKIAMIKVANRFKELKLESKLILQIHDELIIDAKQNELEIVKQVLTTCMESVGEFVVPLIVSVNEGKSWFDAK